MKKSVNVLFVALLFSSCAELQGILDVAEPGWDMSGYECLVSRDLKIIQVLDHGVLAYLCPSTYSSEYKSVFEACKVKEEVVYLEVPKTYNDFVDHQEYTLPKKVCFAKDGTYKYKNKWNDVKTIRKLIAIKDERLYNWR